MRLVALPGKIISKRDHTLIIMGDGNIHQAVCIPSASGGTDEVLGNLGTIERIASMKAERGEIAFDGRVWLTAIDLLQQARIVH